MAVMKTFSELLNALLETLVMLFRAAQILRQLSREERLALYSGDTARLSTLTARKAALLEEVSMLEVRRHATEQQLSAILASGTEFEPEQIDLTAILASVDNDTARHLEHLWEGLQVLTAQVRDLERGNQALVGGTPAQTSFMQVLLSESSSRKL